ncbi:peptidoglycan-binding domain-containing protein [Bacilliculturomica massiliensis]|uniref:peptidoglycan-binding domain-containing protein n=1 Tax=Bacilliculturomica massiliensis TaxID=1917867 RepID=UPI0013EF409C|nr:peptidoglycan-binding protein [Bacilliculturomica massiliensis]
MAITSIPYIPQYITVHLGTPGQYAQNVTVSFADYIKNVASSEIYPTWNEEALKANIYAQISYAVNRVYTEFYRSQGYDFDITNSTSVDQKFINGRNIFDNIDRLVSEIFNIYISRIGNVEPLAAKFCNGTTSTCDGLSQWGSEELAQQGYTAFPILQYYYGDDIDLVTDAPIRNIRESYPGTAQRLGSRGEPVTIIQSELNRISQNYPLIPKISSVDGIFGPETENAVKVFQGIFNLTQDGIVGKATWYKLVNLYVGIARLSELNSEGVKLFETSLEYPDAISEGNSGEKVEILQYFLSLFSEFYLTVPPVAITGVFGPETKSSVLGFQGEYGLPLTGVVDAKTWNVMYDAFRGIAVTVFTEDEIFAIQVRPYGGTVLKLGSAGEDVTALQEYINALAFAFLDIDPVAVTGVFDESTENSVKQYQRLMGLPETGEVDRTVWNAIINSYKDVLSAVTSRPIQYPGRELKKGDSDENGAGKTPAQPADPTEEEGRSDHE